MSSTTNHKLIKASADKIYAAFTNPKALETWMAPDEMTAKISDFDLRVGGGYTMSLFYPETETSYTGKTADKEDRYRATFMELVPDKKLVISNSFQSNDHAFSGDMLMTVELTEQEKGTLVSIVFDNIPSGIKPEDNEAGTESSLQKLAAFVEND